MSKPTYIYFNIRARGELPRLVAAVGGLDYVDTRITFSQWPGEYKSKAPYGQLPVLTVDGKSYAQKLAISLFFARKAGLYPTSGEPVEILKYDHILQFTEEILEQIIQARVDSDLRNKPETLVPLKEEILPSKVPLLEKLLKENGTGFFAGNKISVVDLSAFDVTEHIVDLLGQSFLGTFPLLKAHYEKVKSNAGLKKYIASRPPGEMKF